MDPPELTERFVSLASTDNKAIVLYYKYFIVPLVLRHVQPHHRLLDLGCAGGVLLTLLKRRGFTDLHGIDAAQALLDRIPDRSIPTVCDNYLNVRSHYPQGYFQAATVFNTLHHLDSTEEYFQFFENLRSVLSPGAVVMVKELHDGLFYKAYNAILHSRMANLVMPGVFNRRDFVQTEETDMHRRFFREFVPRLEQIVQAQGRFTLVKRYRPLTFEQVLVLQAQ